VAARRILQVQHFRRGGEAGWTVAARSEKLQPMRITVTPETFRLAEPFTIARGTRTEAHVLTVRVEDGEVAGWGECVPYARYGETSESVAAQIESVPGSMTRNPLHDCLPPGAARNGLDCALWDLAAKRAGKRVWELTGRPAPGPVQTAFSLSLDTPEKMRQAAAKHAHRPLLKIKLGTAEDMARLEAVREGAPRSRIIVDANEGWTAEIYADLAPHMVRLGVAMVEQPLPAGADEMLAEIARPLPVCADESCHDRASLAELAGKYDVINIKLDKTGGLTEAYALRDIAHAQGYGVMVGCMVSTSLSMAPATLVAQGADFVDLDGPLLLAEDRAHPLRYDAEGVHPPDKELWG
jgi:L-alanine-DL-glutamate epimerase-like enolase superfamily enzyme